MMALAYLALNLVKLVTALITVSNVSQGITLLKAVVVNLASQIATIALKHQFALNAFKTRFDNIPLRGVNHDRQLGNVGLASNEL